jgi:histidinol-phosphate/aromatic aminotransferase/cobyric acid decarboxylase-like protein
VTHGGDGAQVARRLGIDPTSVLDLSASLNPVAPDVSSIVAGCLDALGRYPDVADATRALAGCLGVDADRVLLTNGGAEAIALLAAELPVGDLDDPEFSLYRRHLARVEPGGPRWRSDPHNPTGRLAAPGDTAAVWDEAFYPLATGRWTSGRNAIILGSLTKVFACPGLRIGYVLADPTLIARLGERQPRWAVNGLAASVVPALLDAADLPAWARSIDSLRCSLVALLEANGYRPLPSDANYLLVPGAPTLKKQLEPHGIVIRDCASFGLPDHVRIAVPDDAGRDRLAAALGA